jgi:iron complex outermembrane receptor protein
MSPDRAVTVETLQAEKIRVRRSTDALRSGVSASAGAVGVTDHRIPAMPAEPPLGGAVEARYGNNPDGHAEVGKLNLSYEHLAAHVDGFHRHAGNVAIAGDALGTAGVLARFGDMLVIEDAHGKLLNRIRSPMPVRSAHRWSAMLATRE